MYYYEVFFVYLGIYVGMEITVTKFVHIIYLWIYNISRYI